MKYIVYTRPEDGFVVVAAPMLGARLAYADGEFAFDRPYAVEELTRRHLSSRILVEDDDTFIRRVARSPDSVPANALNVRIVDEPPADRTFREAWEQDRNGKVTVNMPKARELHRASLRQKRAPLLAALDIEYQRADEEGNAASKRAIAGRKNKLRDVTSDRAIESARTPEELANVVPDILK